MPSPGGLSSSRSAIRPLSGYALSKTALSQSLEEMEPEDVFRQLLTECHKEEAARKRLMETFEEALAIVRSE